MKKIVVFLLIVIMTMTFSYVAPVPCNAEITVPVSGQYDDNVKWSIDENYTLTIEGTGNIPKYNNDDELFRKRSVVKKIVVKEGITSIDNRCFWTFNEVEEVVLPESLEIIKDYAFDGCTKLKTINIPKKVTCIPWGCFSGCSSLKSLDLPDGLVQISNYAFSRCYSIEELYIPESVTNLRPMAFQDMTKLKKVNIPKRITVLPEFLFSGCNSFETFEIPKQVTTIGKNVFSDCHGLEYMNIPANVKIISEGAFRGCKYLERIEFTPDISFVDSDAFWGCSRWGYVRFTGHYDKNMFTANTFRHYTGIIYYPADDPTWKDAVGKYYSDPINEVLANFVPEEPPHQHKEEVIPAVNPTNTTTGLTEGKKCSACGEILQKQKSIPAISKVTLYKNVDKTYSLTSGKAASWSITSGGKYASIKGAKLTVKAAGTVKVKDKKSGKTVTITIKNPTLKLSITPKVTMKKGETFTVTAKATPAATVKWSSGNKAVATVSAKGKVTAVKKGTATISAKANGVTKKFGVTVK